MHRLKNTNNLLRTVDNLLNNKFKGLKLD